MLEVCYCAYLLIYLFIYICICMHVCIHVYKLPNRVPYKPEYPNELSQAAAAVAVVVEASSHDCVCMYVCLWPVSGKMTKRRCFYLLAICCYCYYDDDCFASFARQHWQQLEPISVCIRPSAQAHNVHVLPRLGHKKERLWVAG